MNLATLCLAAVPAQAGTLELESVMVGPNVSTSFDPGTVANAGLVIETNFLTIAPTGMLDLRDNTLIVRQTPYASILPYLVSGYNGGLWTGFGINSSIAAADALALTAVGIINNAEAQYPTFAGRTLGPAAEVLVQFAYYGDANLDGDVNAADFALYGTGAGWYRGDFNYDGAVTAADLALFTTSFMYLHPGEPLPQDAPEPGTLSLLAVAVAAVAGRRRRAG